MGPEARGACPEWLVEGREPQGLGLQTGRIEEHRLPGNPQHFLPLRCRSGKRLDQGIP